MMDEELSVGREEAKQEERGEERMRKKGVRSKEAGGSMTMMRNEV